MFFFFLTWSLPMTRRLKTSTSILGGCVLLTFVPSMRSALAAGSCGGPFEAIFILDVSLSIASDEFNAEKDGLLNCLCGADSIPADGTVAVSRGRPAPGEHGAPSAVLL